MRIRDSLSARDQKGFTIPELLVVITFVVLLVIASAFILRPKLFEVEQAMADRRIAAAQLVTMLARYHADKGSWPAAITTTPLSIGSELSNVKVCTDLVPAYGKDIPLDPIAGAKLTADKQNFSDEPCTADVVYDSGFLVSVSKDGTHITVSAPAILEYAEVSITR